MSVKLSTRSNQKATSYLFLSDIHVPYHDKTAIKLATGFITLYKPDVIYLIGDIIDFYSLSKYDKDPKRLLTLQDDIDETIDVLDSIRKAAGDATPIFYRSGNHEYRLDKYLVSHPEISQLRAMKLSSLLEFEQLNITEIGYSETHILHGIQVEHGDIVRKRSGYTAGGMLDRRWSSGISGHTHRLGVHHISNMSGDHFWAENGCLCSLSPHYLIGRPDWQQGFSMMTKIDEHMIVEQAKIIGGKMMFRDQRYHIDGRSVKQ
jgi:predicted MPP superfamily phosphohydrolase